MHRVFGLGFWVQGSGLGFGLRVSGISFMGLGVLEHKRRLICKLEWLYP